MIKVGDLVMVVRGHKCALRIAGGIPFTVTAIIPAVGGGWYCPVCNTHDAGPNEAGAEGFGQRKGTGIPFSWLKRIDAPLDSEEIKEGDTLENGCDR